MALDLTPDQKETGAKNFAATAGELSRRGFMKSMAAGAAVVPVSAAVYFGYSSWKGSRAVKTAVIGCGDEGGVLVGDHNPEFNEIVAVCEIRPYNMRRIFDGEPAGPRKGLNKIYGPQSAKQIGRYDSLDALLADKSKLGLEAVVIATPLNTHDVITRACMDAGLHVLCEKLMARTITKCKGMITHARDTGKLLSVGHQRHYSTLYAHALEVVNAGVLGEIKHIRALWHRNNSWPFTATEAEKAKFAPGFDLPYYRDGWCKPVLKEDADKLTPAELERLAFGNVAEYGFKDVAELVRWRLFDKTGGGLMAELGSHQLDASSLILGGVHPIAVSGVGGKFFYGPGRNDRESDDGVFVTYEFPGKNHPKAHKGGKDESDIVVVTYSSFNTNSFESYGECVMGSRGTMVVEQEKDIYLYKEPEPGKAASGGRDTAVTTTVGGGGKPAMEASSTWGAAGGSAVVKAAGAAAWDTPVRGYRTEMEHFAFCVRQWGNEKVSYDKDADGNLVHAARLPRCHGEVAMADAILALTANMAMNRRERIVFEEDWFKPGEEANPESKYGKKA